MSKLPTVADTFHFDLPVWMIGEGVIQGQLPNSVVRLNTTAGSVLPMFTAEDNCERFIKRMGRGGKTAWLIKNADVLIEVIEKTGVANVVFDVEPGCKPVRYPADKLTDWVRQRWPVTIPPALPNDHR